MNGITKKILIFFVFLNVNKLIQSYKKCVFMVRKLSLVDSFLTLA